MSSLYTKVTLNSFSLTGPALAADGTKVDGWLASRFVGNPAGVAAPPSVAADLTQVTTASGLATLTGATLSTTYWLRVRLPTGQQGWFLFNTYGGASSGDPFTVVMPTPPAVAASSGGITTITSSTLTVTGGSGPTADLEVGPRNLSRSWPFGYVDNTAYQNTTGKPVFTNTTFDLPYSGGAPGAERIAVVSVETAPNNNDLLVWEYIDFTSGQQQPYQDELRSTGCLVVPPLAYWRWTGFGSAVLLASTSAVY